MAELATTYHAQGRYEEAEKIYMEVLGLQRDALGEKHPDTTETMYGLANSYRSLGNQSEAVHMMGDCFELRSHILGLSHPWTQASLHTLNTWKGET